MDGERFDTFARALGRRIGRRGALGSMAVGAALLGGAAASARGRGHGGAAGITPQGVEKFTAKAGVYDPDKTGCPVAKWQKKVGLPDQKGKKRQGLVLQKNCPVSTNAAAGAEIVGAQGITLTQLGFDVKGYCNSGSPRFNVYTKSDYSEYYFIGCSYGLPGIDMGSDFTRLRFTEPDFVPVNPAMPPFKFGSTQVFYMEIVADEEGQSVIDNIAINSWVIDKKK